MQPSRLVLRGLAYYWRTNVAVVLGVATAVAVLAGALLVGDSVRGSLRDLVLQRLGRTDRLVVSSGFFREALADDLRADETFAASFNAICPMIAVQGLVTDQASGHRASRVLVYGVDDRFWRFHDGAGERPSTSSGRLERVERRGPEERDALLSRALAAEIGATPGGTLLVRVQRPSAIPIELLQGRKDDLGRTLRMTVRAVVGPSDLGDFSLQPQQGDVRAVFLPLKRIQQDLELEGRVNVLLVSERRDGAGPSVRRAGPVDPPAVLETLVRRRARLEDLGLTLRTLESRHVLALESAAGLLDEARATAADRAAESAGMKPQPVLTYLVNSLRSGDRQVPYSLVTATDLRAIVPRFALDAVSQPPVAQAFRPADAGLKPRATVVKPNLITDTAAPPPIVVNEWAARNLGVRAGDPLTLDYSVWEEPGRLLTRTADFRIAAVVPIEGAAADRDLAPVYPGITDSDRLRDWDPPFPIDLRRVRPADEDYWEKYRTTPKAFIPLEVGQTLWRSRYGERSSVRIAPKPDQSLPEARDLYAERLHARIDPLAMGLSVHDVRADGLAASRGATDFGAYFTYFSFFLVVSALLLAALFFRLGIEQRAREVGLLRSVGFTTSAVRRLFAAEGLVLAAIGSLLGVAGAVGYGYLMMTGLRTWWAGAVGTTALGLHVSAVSLAAGAAGVVVAAMACIWWTLGGLARLSERSLLAGQLAVAQANAGLKPRATAAQPVLAGAMAFAILGAALMGATLTGVLNRTAAFFGAGTSLLMACLCLLAFVLRRSTRRLLHGHGWWAVSRIGLRNAADRPGRSVLSIAVIASATFILISVDAFRREGPTATDRHSGVGGYPLLVELLLPIAHDPNSREGRETLGLARFQDATIEPFRVLPGDDASCLNLYEPKNPRVMGASARFIASGRFAFQSSLASNDAERANPWLILNRGVGDDIVPVIADANSMTYVLHRKLGDDIVITRGGRPVRLRLVAALADSIFQGELVMSEANFLKLFPEQEGYQFLLVEAPPERVAQIAASIEEAGADIGADAVPTVERLAEFHRVENTYLATFQTLGGLGLLVGTVGLAAVLLRNVLERRRELALLGAVGYGRAQFFAIVVAENALLLGWGLAVGTASALVAITPAVADRGGRLPMAAGGWLLLFAVFVAGLLSSVIATRAALRTPLLEALRAE